MASTTLERGYASTFTMDEEAIACQTVLGVPGRK